ncbi:hypothetical protein SUGI_1157040, partial [Cryptomeria japonica]
EKNALWSFGMILYTLDRLYKVTERHAKESGEWQSLHADILDLANPKLAVHYKLHISARMVQVLPTFLQEFDHCSDHSWSMGLKEVYCKEDRRVQRHIPRKVQKHVANNARKEKRVP